jgi:hypothetical protein
VNERGLSLLIFIAAISAGSAIAADTGGGKMPTKATRSSLAQEVPQVPGDDIFGFTSPTDVGNPGDSNFVNENDGRTSKRQGSYGALNTKYEFSRTVAQDWWIAGSLFDAYYHSRDVTGINDVNNLNFDGMSFEIEHRVVKRSVGQPFAVSVSVEPRWGRLDGVAGVRSNSYGAAFKLFVDAPVVPDKLYWAANATWAPQRAEDPNDTSQWLVTSSTLLSTALTYQITARLFAGVEVRYLSTFNAAWLKDNLGNALYVGPTMLWKITDKIGFNATFQPQVAGRSTASPDLNLDLDNFERAQFRAKITVAFN